MFCLEIPVLAAKNSAGVVQTSSLKYSVLVATNTAGNCPMVQL